MQLAFTEDLMCAILMDVRMKLTGAFKLVKG